jgi:transposase
VKAATSFSQIFIHREPVDMRRGINGLCDLVQSSGMGDLSGRNLFVFSGRRKNSIKVLYFDRTGFCLWQKRLEENRFSWPRKFVEDIVTVTPEQFEWLLEGYDIWKMKPFSETKFERVS